MSVKVNVTLRGKAAVGELSDDGETISVVVDGRVVTVPAKGGNYSIPKRVGVAAVAAHLGLKTTPVAPKPKPVVKRAESVADRPVEIVEMIGQDRPRTQLTIHVKAAKHRGTVPAHVLLTGPAGVGKSSMAELAAREIGGKLIRCSAPTLTTLRQLAQVLGQLSSEQVDTIFIDEVHALSSKLSDALLTALEDRRIELPVGAGRDMQMRSIQLPPFVVVAATTVEGEIDKPFKDRFGLQLQLDFYQPSELTRIIERAAEHKGLRIVPPAAQDLARRSQGTPRGAKALLGLCADYAAAVDGSNVIDSDVVVAALDLAGVDERGLDQRSRSYLRTLCTEYRGGPVGILALAATSSIDARTVGSAIEPYLLRDGLLRLTSGGRMATKETFAHLQLPVPAQFDLDDDAEVELDAAVIVVGDLVAEVEPVAEFGIADFLAQTDDEPEPEPTIGALIDSISSEIGELPVTFRPSDDTAPVVKGAPVATQSAVSTPVAPRALWSGTLSASMMSLPVRLHSLHSDDHGPKTHSVHDADGGKIRYQKVCAGCEQVIDTHDIGRSDGCGHVSFEELTGLDAEALKDIAIESFVPAGDVDVALYESHYQVSSGKGGDRPYVLLRETLRSEEKVAVARLVLRSTERVAVVRVVENTLVLTLLRWADQMKATVDVPDMVEFTAAEAEQARALVDAMSAKFVHADHTDARAEKLAEMLAG
jgi:Holliday junction DNA helicase RuvB